MAQFEPKKLNIGEINDGNRFNNGDGIGAEAINAPIEAALYAEEIAQEAIGVKEQVQDHEERIAQTEYDTKMLYAIASQKGLYAVAEVEQAYTSRVTANGENIVDGQKTPVTLIKGSTKRCENLCDIDEMLADGLLTKNGNVYTMTKDVSHPYIRFSGWCTFKNPLPAGTYTIGADLVEDKTLASNYYWLEVDIRLVDGTQTSIGLRKGSNTNNFTATNKIEKIRLYISSSNEDKAYYSFKNLMFNAGETLLPYQPYFTDLKHAKIDSIVSTGRNLLDISKLVGDALVDNGDGTYTMTKNGNNRWSRVWTLDTPILVKDIFSNLELVEKTTTTEVLAVIATLTNGVQKFFGLRSKLDGLYGIGGEVKSFQFYLNSTEPDGVYFKFKNPFITRQVEGNNYYTPFIQETYQLPETLELPEWDSFNPQTGEITRGTKRLVLTGNEYVGVTDQSANGRGYELNIDITNNPAPFDYIGTYYAISPEYKTVSREDVYIDDGSEPVIGCAGNYIRIKDPRFNYPTGNTDFKAYVKERYETGNPLIVEYKLATPTIEKLENAPKSYTAYNQGNETAVLENEEFGAIPTITNEYIVVL